jgi:hypothetical protein
MFGFLSGPSFCCEKAAQVYRAQFCGLATSLHRHFGPWARALVNRDSTFLALLGSSLSPHGPALQRTTCCNPLAPARDLASDCPTLQYVASTTLCGLCAKLEDDAEDERGWRASLARTGGWLLDEAFSKAIGHLHAVGFPVHEVRAKLANQSATEHATADLAACAAPTSQSYGHIVSHLGPLLDRNDLCEPLHQLGHSLGRLVYAQDAWEDWAEDQRKQRFNPLHALPHLDARRTTVTEFMSAALGEFKHALSRLPLQRNRDLMHQIAIEGTETRLSAIAGKPKPPEKKKKPDLAKKESERDGCSWCDCCDPCDCVRIHRPKCGKSTRDNSMCDCNPCDGDGCECCGCDCG